MRLTVHSGQACGVVAMTTATPMRQKIPRSARLHCAAVSSLVPRLGLSRAGMRGAARAGRWGCVAISQAPLLAQALHEVFINGLRNGAVQHGISFWREAGPLNGRGRIKKASALASGRNQRRYEVNALRALVQQTVALNFTVIFISAVHLYSSLILPCTARQQTSTPCVAWPHRVSACKEKAHRRWRVGLCVKADALRRAWGSGGRIENLRLGRKRWVTSPSGVTAQTAAHSWCTTHGIGKAYFRPRS